MMLTFQFGLCMSFSGIIIAALNNAKNEHNQNETLVLSDAAASWLGNLKMCRHFFRAH